MIFYIANNTIVGTQAEARAIDRGFTQVDIPTDKAGLMSYIQGLMDLAQSARKSAAQAPQEPDHTEPDQAEPVAAPAPAPAPAAPTSYAERTAYIDEIFENLPLAHQLTLATLALENARTRLP